MNELGKTFRKKIRSKKLEKAKPLARKRIFVQTPFSHSTSNLSKKKIHAAKPLAFSLHFLFRRDQNHYSNLTPKIMKICEQILKKETAPQYNSNSLNIKKTAPQYNSNSLNCKKN